jgi:hypothetical protein
MEEKQPEKDDILKKKQQPTEQGKRVQIPPRPPNPLSVRFTPSNMLYFLKFPYRK